jgi:hypothetical protein
VTGLVVVKAFLRLFKLSGGPISKQIDLTGMMAKDGGHLLNAFRDFILSRNPKNFEPLADGDGWQWRVWKDKKWIPALEVHSEAMSAMSTEIEQQLSKYYGCEVNGHHRKETGILFTPNCQEFHLDNNVGEVAVVINMSLERQPATFLPKAHDVKTNYNVRDHQIHWKALVVCNETDEKQYREDFCKDYANEPREGGIIELEPWHGLAFPTAFPHAGAGCPKLAQLAARHPHSEKTSSQRVVVYFRYQVDNLLKLQSSLMDQSKSPCHMEQQRQDTKARVQLFWSVPNKGWEKVSVDEDLEVVAKGIEDWAIWGKAEDADHRSLLYHLDSVKDLLQCLDENDTVFVDVGAGLGLLCTLVALFRPNVRVVGIESEPRCAEIWKIVAKIAYEQKIEEKEFSFGVRGTLQPKQVAAADVEAAGRNMALQWLRLRRLGFHNWYSNKTGEHCEEKLRLERGDAKKLLKDRAWLEGNIACKDNSMAHVSLFWYKDRWDKAHE